MLLRLQRAAVDELDERCDAALLHDGGENSRAVLARVLARKTAQLERVHLAIASALRLIAESGDDGDDATLRARGGDSIHHRHLFGSTRLAGEGGARPLRIDRIAARARVRELDLAQHEGEREERVGRLLLLSLSAAPALNALDQRLEKVSERLQKPRELVDGHAVVSAIGAVARRRRGARR